MANTGAGRRRYTAEERHDHRIGDELKNRDKIKYDFEAEYLCLQIMSCYTFNKYCVIFTFSLYVHALNRVARQKLVVMLDKAAPSTDTMKA